MRNTRKHLRSILSILLIACMILSCVPVVAAEAETRIQDLETDQHTTPMGMDNPKPEFRWEMVSDVRGQKQTAYQIVVRDGEDVIWDTGKVLSDRSNAIAYDGMPLESSTRYDWTVTVWDKDGKELPAQSSWFEMGLLNQAQDWAGAEFIAPAAPEDDAVVNYTIEFDFKIERSCASLIFGATDASHFLMWQVNAWETTNPNHHGEKVYFRPHIWNGSPKMLIDLDISHIISWEERLDTHTMKIEVVGTTVYTYIVYATCAAVLAALCLLQGYDLFSYGWDAPLVGLLLAVFSTIMGHSIFSWCLKFFSPSFVSAAKLCEPVVAAVLAVFLFGEVPAVLQIVGGAMILGGVYAYSRLERSEN